MDINAGFYFSEISGQCAACPTGTYRPAGSKMCLPCQSGHHASASGSPFCTTCPTGTYSEVSGVQCIQCPAKTSTLFPGASSEDQCIHSDKIKSALDSMFNKDVLSDKLLTVAALEKDLHVKKPTSE
jgi:hypothetical protein